ncbi:hypothetical protein DMENIID0001_155300 [Sergentomyia squamirostris]
MEDALEKFSSEKSFKSKPTADDGFKFQEEILLHLAIRFSELEYKDFTIGYEFEDIPKFDDVVCEIKSPFLNCFLVIQAKHLQSDSVKLEHQHFFSPTSKSIKRGRKQKSLWEKFNLNQYLKSIQELRKSFKDKKVKFIVITNVEIEEKMKVKMMDVSDPNLTEIFLKMGSEVKIQTFGDDCKEDFKQISPNVNFENFLSSSKRI